MDGQIHEMLFAIKINAQMARFGNAIFLFGSKERRKQIGPQSRMRDFAQIERRLAAHLQITPGGFAQMQNVIIFVD